MPAPAPHSRVRGLSGGGQAVLQGVLSRAVQPWQPSARAHVAGALHGSGSGQTGACAGRRPLLSRRLCLSPCPALNPMPVPGALHRRLGWPTVVGDARSRGAAGPRGKPRTGRLRETGAGRSLRGVRTKSRGSAAGAGTHKAWAAGQAGELARAGGAAASNIGRSGGAQRRLLVPPQKRSWPAPKLPPSSSLYSNSPPRPRPEG